jgi:hypothetical protein
VVEVQATMAIQVNTRPNRSNGACSVICGARLTRSGSGYLRVA